MTDRVRCSICKVEFRDPMHHTGCCDEVYNNLQCMGIAERFIPPTITCPACNGARITGTHPDSGHEIQCGECGGTGHVAPPR